MERRELWTDAALVLFVLVATLLMLGSHGFGTPDADVQGLDAAGALMSGVTAVPLLWRRRAPMLVYVVTAGASLALLALDYGVDVPFGALVAIYALGDAAPPPAVGGRRGALLASVLFAPAIVAAYVISGDSPLLLPEMVGLALIVTGVWVAGDRSRLRREELARERRLAVAEERTRIARELHDSAGHAINTILVQAGAARLLRASDPDGSRAAIATIEEVARETIGDIDRLVRALRDDEAALPAIASDASGLEDLVELHRSAGLAVTSHVDGDRRELPRSVAWAAYRILQEALTNAVRHGRERASVAVRFGPDALEIEVTNPTGAAVTGRAGHGIVGMRERATLLGGRLEAGARDGVFRLHAWLPYGEAAR